MDMTTTRYETTDNNVNDNLNGLEIDKSCHKWLARAHANEATTDVIVQFKALTKVGHRCLRDIVMNTTKWPAGSKTKNWTTAIYQTWRLGGSKKSTMRSDRS